MNRETLQKANELIEKINALKAIGENIRMSDSFEVRCSNRKNGEIEWIKIPREIMDYLETFVTETQKKLSKEFEEL